MYLLDCLEYCVRLDLLGDIGVLYHTHALKIFAKVAFEHRIHGGIIDGYHGRDCLGGAQSHGHSNLGTPTIKSSVSVEDRKRILPASHRVSNDGRIPETVMGYEFVHVIGHCGIVVLGIVGRVAMISKILYGVRGSGEAACESIACLRWRRHVFVKPWRVPYDQKGQ